MAQLTPMMQQYYEIKKNYEDCILFYRLGDFYEMFFEDAITASRELDITLTGRDCGQKERAPMCGVPYHSADGYIAKLIEKGYKVAICEQVGDPKLSKTIVKREVIRVVTPGTVTDYKSLDENRNNFILCIYENPQGFGIAAADVSTGDFLTTSFPVAEAKKVTDEIAKFNPSEILVNEGYGNKTLIKSIFNIRASTYNPWTFEYINAYKCLCSHFAVLNLKGFGIEENELAIGASGALMDYLNKTQMNALNHITAIKNYSLDQFMFLDISSRKNLELCETIREKSKKGSLLWVLDKTMTAMGSRLLRRWLEQPLLNLTDINHRLDAVAEFKEDPMFRGEIKELLNTVLDIERILSRIVYGTAGARDLIALKKSIEHLPSVKMMMMQLKSALNVELYEKLDCVDDIYTLIHEAVIEEPPFSIREGGFIQDGYNETLDTLRQAKNNGTQWLKDIEERERANTGIKSLKIKYNKVFGYFIEVTNSYLSLVPDTYVRRQTITNAERFTTQELKEIEEQILGADEKIAELEYDLFVAIRKCVSEELPRIQSAAYILSTIDVLQSFGEAADKNNYVKPKVNATGIIDIKEGRHPVVEKMAKEAFVPNDTYLNTKEARLSIITGPNMAGKSTYMRQTALIVLMAQTGCFIPAAKGDIGIVDRIFTRVGASDDLATGQSTFMVEMSEVANILNNASNNSLLILDEIGRGTSTYDGLSIAWAVLEYIADKNKLGSKTLFATHYHELTELEGRVDGVNNYRVMVQEEGKDIVFLRKIQRGGADRSYGIHVAKVAGIPPDVIHRANEIMLHLLQQDIIVNNGEGDKKEVIYYGKKKPSSANTKSKNMIIEEIEKLDLENMTKAQLMAFLTGALYPEDEDGEEL